MVFCLINVKYNFITLEIKGISNIFSTELNY